MDIRRLPPFPLTAEFSGLSPSSNFIATLASERNGFIADVLDTSDGAGVAEFTLPERCSRYDGEYSVIVYEDAGAGVKGDVVAMDNLSIRRPYVNAAALAPTVAEIEKYWGFERRARLMIDAIVGGFYYEDIVIQQNGLGSDLLPLGWRACKLLKVVENNVLMYELGSSSNIAQYAFTPNMQALVVNSSEEVNLSEGSLTVTTAGSDSYDNPNYRSVAFPNGYDYSVEIESGWPSVPGDVQEVTKILIEDLACDAPNYIQKYVREYETKDFRADFQRSAFAGTGNLVVDQILQKYWGQNLYNNARVI